MTITDRIEINPKVMLGKPVIRGTRIPVELILRKLSEGANEADLLEAYPKLTREDIQAAIRYAAETLAHEEIIISGQGGIPLERHMRFLADESCDSIIIKTLREAGHDVLAVGEITPRAEDSGIISLAHREKRILLTEDKDFGQLVFAHGEKSLGVLFLRYPFPARTQIARDVSDLIMQQAEKLIGCFVTIQPGRIRVSHIPAG